VNGRDPPPQITCHYTDCDIKIENKETGWDRADWMQVTDDRNHKRARYYEHGNVSLGSIKCMEYLD
jgi:hypothetical protein